MRPDDVQALRLSKQRERRNKITDVLAWFDETGFVNPKQRLGEEPGARRRAYGLPLQATFPGLFLYGDRRGQAVLVGEGKTSSESFALRLTSLLTAVAGGQSDGGLLTMDVLHAQQQDQVLYLSMAHRTYAGSSNGHNGYILALRVPEGKLLWSSKPLVANAETFVVLKQHIVTGYGFTAEPDFLYVLNKTTGRVVSQAKVKSAPEYLFVRGETLFVRAYNRNYEFALLFKEG